MNALSHFLAGLIVAILILFNQFFTFVEIIIIIVFSNFVDLDHIATKYLGKSEYHLRTFVQEPLGMIAIGFPSATILGLFFGFQYFWLVLALCGTHLALDYVCVFETYPLDPITTKVVKHEGNGLVFPWAPGWNERRSKFPKAIHEKYVMIVLAGILGVVSTIHLVIRLSILFGP